MTPQTDLRDDTDDALSRAARRAHAASLDHLSPRVQAQLAQRRRAAMQPGRSARRGWAMIAAGSAAVLALAVGVFVIRDQSRAPQMADEETPSAAPIATTPAAQATPDTRIADAATSEPVSTAAPDAVAAPQVDAADSAPEEDRASLPDTLIAAEFDAVEAIDDAGYDGFDETPDFYAWLGSEDALAEAPESL
ncbi:MAG: hypothetical protein JNM58_14055 [Xanthomonadaceae bacterium]|nr:hypothetical protein [Xanthomonadaceae bacterium]